MYRYAITGVTCTGTYGSGIEPYLVQHTALYALSPNHCDQETKRERVARPIGPALETCQPHTIEYGVKTSLNRDNDRGIKVLRY